MKILVMLLLMMVELSAINQNGVFVGKWQSISQTKNKGTLTIEKEYLTLNANSTFSILLLVSVQKGDAFVRDLQIKGSGIWSVHNDTLVYVVKKVDVPFAKEVYRISQESLLQLANYFKKRLTEKPILINTIQSMDGKHLTLINEREVVTRYTR
ncbi:MAG: hypothetical protein ABF276_04290 [Sulfurovum sp.]